MKKQSKKLLSLLLAFVMLVGMLPMTALAEENGEDPANVPIMMNVDDDSDGEPEEDPEEATADSEEPTKLDENSGAEPEGGIMPLEVGSGNTSGGTLQFDTDLKDEYFATQSSWNMTRLTVAVKNYVPEGGTATELPAGTTVTYQWYKSSDAAVDNGDETVTTGTYYNPVLSTCGITYYYVVATAIIDGVTYTGTSTVACFKVGAKSINVTLTVNNKGVMGSDKNGAAVCSKSITVSDVDCNGILSYDEALVAAHSSLLTADGYATATTEYGLSVTKLWGVETTNCLFYLNGAALTVNVGETTVKANDALYASINQDGTYYSDKFTTFDATSKTVSTGVSFDLILKDVNGNVVPGIAVGTWKDGAFVPMEGVTTDEAGKVTLSFQEAGTYYVTAKGTIRDTVTDYSNWPETSEVEHDCPIMAPGAAITVKQLGELKFVTQSAGLPGSFGAQPYTYKVGETNTFNSILVAKYYVNDVYDSAVKVTTTWYRIKEGDTEPQVVTNVNAAFTDADIGTWQYYMEAECDAYGVPMTAQTNYATVVVSAAAPLVGTAANGYISDLDYLMSYNLPTHPDFQYEEGKTDYTISRQNKAKEALSFSVQQGSGLWYGWRIDGIKTSASKDTEYAVKTGKTVSLNLPTVAPVGETHTYSLLVGLKYDSNQNGVINGDDDFDPAHCDVYNFTATTKPGLPSNSITVKDDTNKKVTMTAAVPYGSYDSYGSTNSETIKLSVTIDTGVKLYIGKDTNPYTATVSNMELSLADYRDEKGVSNIPLYVYAADGTEPVETVTLHLNGIAEANPEITGQPTAESTIEKGEKITLSVTVTEPTDGNTLSYQWKVKTSKITSSSMGTDIPGATSSSYEVEGQEILRNNQNPKYYACLVTLTTPDGKTTSVLSDNAKVTTNLTYVSEPVITVQPGLCANIDGKGIYKTEYVAPAHFDPMWFGVQSSNVSKNGTYVDVTEIGCNPFEVECFYNTTPSTEGAIQMPVTKSVTGTTGSGGAFYSYTPEEGLPVGEYYVFFKVTSTAEDDSSKTASTYTDLVKLTYTTPELGLDGSGTEADPYLLKTGADFVTIRESVEAGINFSGIYLKMANDINLPEDWESIGSSGENGKYFGGTLDGGGHRLNFATRSQPLIHHAKGAVIKNLKIYGEEIQGCALIDSAWINQTSEAWIAKINNVTLMSGTSTLKSGLVQGSESTYNPIDISNCKVEKNVIIGYDKSMSGIGTFAGGLVGTMTNCHSAATVYGVNNVGGLIGAQSNSMAAGSFTNCSFTGTIEATGNNVGGIIGTGYNAVSAPNAMCVSIQNCYVSASITGKTNVGGLLGSNAGIDQCWDNGIGYIRNNVFYGTLNGEKNIGGLVGYYSSLNKYNIIENNYYYDTNGCNTPIGGVEHIDTSTHEFGMGEDGIFYYNTSVDSLDDIKEFVDAEDKDTDDWRYTSVCKTGHNRADDPMGADKEKLGKACTDAEMADGTVLKLLNESETSQKNWAQGEKHPEFSDEAYVTGLTVSGDYKTEYYIGEQLDMTGAVFTVTWSDGSTINPTLDTVKITGFDSSERAILLLTASYGVATTQFEVKILKKPTQPEVGSSTINVYFTLLGDKEHGDPTEETGTHTLKDKNLVTWIAKTAYTVDMNATVWDLMQEVARTNANVSFSNPKGYYVDYVTFNGKTIGEFDNGILSGWMYTLNGKHPLLGVSEQFLENGDNIVFHYTDDYTVEEGSEEWGGSTSTPTTKPATSEGITIAPEVTVTNGEAKAEVSEKNVADAITAAKKDGAAAIVISPVVKGDANKVVIELPTNAVKDIVSGTNAALNIQTAVGALNIPNDTLAEIVKAAGTANIAMSVEKADGAVVKEKLPETAKVDGAVAVEFKITSGSKTISSFGGKALEVSVPVNTKDHANGKSYVAFIISDDGTVEKTVAAIKNGAAILTMRHFSTVVVTKEETAAFTDVKESDYYYEPVKWAVEKGITAGTSDTTFSPNAGCTRAQMVTFLWRAAGSPEPVGKTNPFADVKETAYYFKALLWAVENGITAGTSATTFSPDAVCTRGQMAAFLYRNAKTPAVSGSSSFTDVTDGDYFCDAVIWAAQKGITSGTTATTFSPNAACTRGQMVTFLYRSLAD